MISSSVIAPCWPIIRFGSSRSRSPRSSLNAHDPRATTMTSPMRSTTSSETGPNQPAAIASHYELIFERPAPA